MSFKEKELTRGHSLPLLFLYFKEAISEICGNNGFSMFSSHPREHVLFGRGKNLPFFLELISILSFVKECHLSTSHWLCSLVGPW